MREDNVDGKLSYGDFYQKMQSKYGHEGCRINKITFLDSNLKNNVGQDGITHSSVVTSSEYQKKGTKDEMSGTLSSAGEAEYKVASMVNSPLGRSIWESKNNDTDINTADVESSSSFSPLSSSSSSSRNFPLNASKNGNSVNNADSGRTSRGVGRGLPSVWSTAIFGTQKSGTVLHNNVILTFFSLYYLDCLNCAPDFRTEPRCLLSLRSIYIFYIF